jgi:hypothetical protein
MRTLEELMSRHYLVGSYPGHAIFWNHSATFTIYRIAESGAVEPLETFTRYSPEGLAEAKKIQWAIYCGREIANEMKGQE